MQEKKSGLFGWARGLAPFAAPVFVVFARVLVAEYILSFAVWYQMADGLRDQSGTPLGADFIDVYAAGLLADRGQAALAYNWGAHGAVEQTVAGYAAPYFGWHYPPMFLAVAGLVAALPYLWAFALYMVASFTGYWTVARRIAPRGKESFWALAAFPGVYGNFHNGQNGFITAGLFGAGLLVLEERPWLAGVLFGLLSYKPQFFVVVPLMLAVGGYGRALLATVMSALVVMMASWVLFGTGVWQAFFASTALTRQVILEQGSTGWRKIQSVFSLARMWGGDVGTAYAAQAVVAVAALMAGAYVWRFGKSLATRAAALCAAMLLTTPYLLDYDLVILAMPIAFLAKQGIEEVFLRYEKSLLALLWLLPLIARSLGADLVPLTPPALIALMVLCVARTKAGVRGGVAPR